jgi:hypothetical protein
LGGSVTDSPERTADWDRERFKALKIIEVRGGLPAEISCPDTGEVCFTDERGGTIPKQRQFQCREKTCGLAQDIVVSVKRSGKSAPMSLCLVQGYCPECDASRVPYGGRFFDAPSPKTFDAANAEWAGLKDSTLHDYWPRSSIPNGYMSPIQNDLPAHGYPRWADMFNPRQLLVHSHLLKTIVTASAFSFDVRDLVLGAFQQYLRNQCMFSFWHIKLDKLAPSLSNNNFHPKVMAVEVGVFSPMGYGPWSSTVRPTLEGLEWCRNPWELVTQNEIVRVAPQLAAGISGKSVKTYPNDPVLASTNLICGSASNLTGVESESVDLVITDPPFGGLVYYAELSDYFYVWLRLALKDRFPVLFSAEFTPKAVEAIANRALHPDDSDAFYQRLLTECWAEANRILKPAGMLAFTFHHSEDEPWVAVLESLFGAGFYLEATYPIRSDEIKAEGQFGSKLIEFDIIHVCRKRLDSPHEISWARLRRQILSDVRQLQEILEHHQQEGLQEADLQVIRRGKALEYYSKHYGKVYVEKGREFTVKEALAGINQLLDDQRDSTAEVPPVDAEPFTRQFLRLFADATSLPRDQIQKYLRGTGVSPNEFQERGWCSEKSKMFHFTPPLELAQKWKGVSRQGMGRDFDQAMFLIGACYENSGIRVQDTLNSEKFIPHPATGDVIDWFTRHGGDAPMKDAAKLAKQLYTKWVASNQPKVKAAQRTFDFAEGDA